MTTTLEPKWKWAVLMGSFVALLIGNGWLCTFGLVYSNLLVTFEESRVATSYVPTLLYGVPMTLSPLVCSAVSRVGCRAVSIFAGVTLFASFVLIFFSNSLTSVCVITGLVTSVGLKCLMVSAFVAVTYWFEDGSRGLATGIAVTGSGFGSVIHPHLINFLMREYLWRGTYLILGAIFLHGVMSGCLYRPFPRHVIFTMNVGVDSSLGNKPCASAVQSESRTGVFRGAKRSLVKLRLLLSTIVLGSFADTVKLFRKRGFVFFCLIQYVLYLFLNIPYLYTYDWAFEHLHLNETQNAWLLSIQGISLTVGLISVGGLVDFNSSMIRPNLLYGTSMMVCGISTFLMPYCPSYEVLLVCCSFFAFSGSVTFVLPLLCVGEVVGMQWAVAGLGIIHLVQGLSILTGTPAGGWIRDVTGSYDPAFYLAGTVMTSIGLVYCIFSSWLRSTNANAGNYEKNENADRIIESA